MAKIKRLPDWVKKNQIGAPAERDVDWTEAFISFSRGTSFSRDLETGTVYVFLSGGAKGMMSNDDARSLRKWLKSTEKR